MSAGKNSFEVQFSSLRQFFFHHGHVHVPNLSEHERLFDFCNSLRSSRSPLPGKVIAELESMGFRWDLYLSNELRWFYHYAELKKFYERFGHSRVTDKKGEYKFLNTWVQRQRRDEKILSQEKKLLLKKVNFLWSGDLRREKEEYWKSMFVRLKAFYKKYKHSNVPDRNPKYDIPLGRWVNTIRVNPRTLKPWQLSLLKSVNFKFSDQIQREKALHRKKLFDALQAYYYSNSHANVPETYSDHKLAIFVAYLRQYPERIQPEEKKKLMKWNFLFSDDIKERWEKMWLRSFKKLEKFKKEFGHCRVSSSYTDRPLARWVANQRKDKKDGKLPLHREKRLKAIGFYFYEDMVEWQEKKWQECYNQLIAFKKKHGTTAVPESHNDTRLVYWVYHQRRNKNTMPVKRRKLLEKIGFV